jgi:hypothetical protein
MVIQSDDSSDSSKRNPRNTRNGTSTPGTTSVRGLSTNSSAPDRARRQILLGFVRELQRSPSTVQSRSSAGQVVRLAGRDA